MHNLGIADMSFLILIFLITANAVPVLCEPVEALPGFQGKLPFKLETGYVGIGKLDAIQLYYYFIESERNPEKDPLIFWLTGGPGCSGFSAIVYEIGPLSFDYEKSSSSGRLPTLKLNPYSWTKVASILFIDAPAGTGFSYATNWEGYVTSDTISATQTYEFLQKWLLSHPQFLKNELYVGGDSYSGIVLPIVVKKISDGKEAGDDPIINLQGFILGNPATDASSEQTWRIPFYHRTALISHKLYQSTKRNCKGEYKYVDPSNVACLENLQVVAECTKKVNPAQILEPACTIVGHKPNKSGWDPSVVAPDNHLKLLLPTNFQHVRRWCRALNYVYSSLWSNDGEVRTALHVRKGTQKDWIRCNTSLSYTFDVTSSIPYLQYLIKKNYRVHVYSGDHDLLVPYLNTIAWIKSLNLSLQRGWEPWYAGGQVGGYMLQYSNLVFSTVKGGGHTAPEYKPKECFAMISKWLAGFAI